MNCEIIGSCFVLCVCPAFFIKCPTWSNGMISSSESEKKRDICCFLFWVLFPWNHLLLHSLFFKFNLMHHSWASLNLNLNMHDWVMVVRVGQLVSGSLSWGTQGTSTCHGWTIEVYILSVCAGLILLEAYTRRGCRADDIKADSPSLMIENFIFSLLYFISQSLTPPYKHLLAFLLSPADG